ncbi:MAG TPA: hypothetical protein VIN08_18915 [Ohtaekwangia sp.]|uniref:hypothetical protein n=1 Tax=Ohtaekwangia sp. TaxID=2066019 RepID=UPI002F95DB17
MKGYTTIGYKIILLLLILTGCETKEILFTGPYFVRFSETSSFAKESYTPTIKIEVHNGGPATEDDILINYAIGGDARENIDYKILTERGLVTIKAGEYFGYIEIQMINNANDILRSQDIVFTLQSSSADRAVGEGESAIGKSFTFTIFDDCVLGGNYTGKSGSYSDSDITITSTDCENFTLSNWNINPNVFQSSIVMDLTFIDNGDNTITIPEQEEQNLVADKATIKGSGTVNPITRVINMEVVLVDFDSETIPITLTPH